MDRSEIKRRLIQKEHPVNILLKIYKEGNREQSWYETKRAELDVIDKNSLAHSIFLSNCFSLSQDHEHTYLSERCSREEQENYDMFCQNMFWDWVKFLENCS